MLSRALPLLLALLAWPHAFAQDPSPAPAPSPESPPEAPVDDPGPATEDPAVPTEECGRCQGEGLVVASCRWCAGAGSIPCGDCAFVLLPLHARAVASRFDPRALEKAETEFEEGITDNRRQGANGEPAYAPGPDPGTLTCPLACRYGKTRIGRARRCPACRGKGHVQCFRCRGSAVGPCTRCDGDGTHLRACDPCRGSGRVPTLDEIARRDPAPCPWCSGKELQRCERCPVDPPKDQACSLCDGSGEEICVRCRGGRKVRCASCRGRGKALGLTDEDCRACRGTAVTRCDTCTLGKTPCRLCEKSGKVPSVCAHCFGFTAHLCYGCLGSSDEAWRATAERLAEGQLHAAAVRYLEQALDLRVKAHELVVQAFEGTDTQRRELFLRLADERRPLEEQLASWRALAR